jgi:hypothetical protein
VADRLKISTWANDTTWLDLFLVTLYRFPKIEYHHSSWLKQTHGKIRALLWSGSARQPFESSPVHVIIGCTTTVNLTKSPTACSTNPVTAPHEFPKAFQRGRSTGIRTSYRSPLILARHWVIERNVTESKLSWDLD